MTPQLRRKLVTGLGDPDTPVADIAKRHGIARSTLRMVASEEGLTRSNAWTMNEVRFLHENYAELGPQPIAEALGRTNASVRSKAISEGLRFRGRHARFKVIEGGAQ